MMQTHSQMNHQSCEPSALLYTSQLAITKSSQTKRIIYLLFLAIKTVHVNAVFIREEAELVSDTHWFYIII